MPLLNHMAKRIHDARRDKTGQVGYFFASELKLLAATLHESLYVYPEKGWPKMQAVAWAFYVIQLRVTRRAHEELAVAVRCFVIQGKSCRCTCRSRNWLLCLSECRLHLA